MQRYLYEEHALPKGFRFPRSFLAFIEQELVPDLCPWRFLCFSPKDADGWYLAVKRMYPDRSLVPFAHWINSDDIACFDGAPADDPLVHYVHAYASPGWEDRGHVSGFEEWLAAAKRQSAESTEENPG
jgi:hypothetical protein